MGRQWGRERKRKRKLKMMNSGKKATTIMIEGENGISLND